MLCGDWAILMPLETWPSKEAWPCSVFGNSGRYTRVVHSQAPYLPPCLHVSGRSRFHNRDTFKAYREEEEIFFWKFQNTN